MIGQQRDAPHLTRWKDMDVVWTLHVRIIALNYDRLGDNRRAYSTLSGKLYIYISCQKTITHWAVVVTFRYCLNTVVLFGSLFRSSPDSIEKPTCTCMQYYHKYTHVRYMFHLIRHYVTVDCNGLGAN